MRFSVKPWIAVPALALAFAFVPASQAQALNSNAPTVNLTATLGESITVAAAPAAVTFALVPNGSVNGSAPVSITSTWALKKTRTSVNLYAFFSSAAALTDGVGDNIPTSAVTGTFNGVGAGAFNTATPFGANGMTLFTLTPGAGTYSSTRTDTLGLSINTTGLGLPAATYTGVLTIEAQAL